MSLQLNFLGSLNATSLPESACGASPPEQQASPTISGSGVDHAHASLSARQAQERGLLTIATFGRTGFGSSRSNALLGSWASRLRLRTALLGSTLYALTWKDRITPGGASIFALRASARPISASGNICVGWTTPSATDGERGGREITEGMTGSSLTQMAPLAGWTTPMAADNRDRGHWDMPAIQRRAEIGKSIELSMMVSSAAWPLSGWQAPTAMDSNRGDYQNDKGDPEKPRLSNTGAAKASSKGGYAIRCEVRQTDSGPMLTGCSVETLTSRSCGLLDAAHSAWLQGIPVDLASCVHTAMRSISKSPRNSSRRSSQS